MMRSPLTHALSATGLAVWSLCTLPVHAQTTESQGAIRTASISMPARAAVRGSISAVKPAPVPPAPAAVATHEPAKASVEPVSATAVIAETTPHPEHVVVAVAAPTPAVANVVPEPVVATSEPVPAAVLGSGPTPAPWPTSLPVPGRTRAAMVPPVEPVTEVTAPQTRPSAPPPAKVDLSPVPASATPHSAQLPTVQTRLPGVGVIPGAKRIAANTVRVSENTVEEVMVSSAFPNRISTPFANPRVIDSSGSDITKDGGSVYIKPANSAPVAIFITGDRPGDPVVSLLLKPAEVGPQTVVLQLDDRLRQSASVAAAAAEASTLTPQTYSTKLVDIVKQVATGITPRGFSGGLVPTSVGRMGDLMLRTETRYSNSSMEVHTYWITNITQRELTLDESMFYADGVLAVAFFPEVQLAPSNSTRVLIVAEVQTEGQ